MRLSTAALMALACFGASCASAQTPAQTSLGSLPATSSVAPTDTIAIAQTAGDRKAPVSTVVGAVAPLIANNLSEMNPAAVRANLGIPACVAAQTCLGGSVTASQIQAVTPVAGPSTAGLVKAGASGTGIAVSNDGSLSLSLLASHVTGALGYTPANVAALGPLATQAPPASAHLVGTDSGGHVQTATLSSSDITTALGATPYPSTNPSNFLTPTTGVTAINGASGSVSITPASIGAVPTSSLGPIAALGVGAGLTITNGNLVSTATGPGITIPNAALLTGNGGALTVATPTAISTVLGYMPVNPASLGNIASQAVPPAGLVGSSGTTLNMITPISGLTLVSNQLGVNFGAGAGTAAQGNDTRITGSEQTSNKGATNGYAGLDGSGHVPASNLPIGVGAGQILSATDSRVSGALQATAAASTYATITSLGPLGTAAPVASAHIVGTQSNGTLTPVTLASADVTGALGYVPPTSAPAATASTGLVKVPTTGQMVVDTSGNIAVGNQIVYTLIEQALRVLPSAPPNAGEYWMDGNILTQVPGTFVPSNASNPIQIFLASIFGSLSTSPGVAGTWWNNGGIPTRVDGVFASPVTTTQDLNTALSYAPLAPAMPLTDWVNGGALAVVTLQ